MFGRKLFEEGPVLFETNHVAKNGDKIPVEVSSHLFDYKGSPTAVSIVRDITERKRLEIEREQAKEVLEIEIAGYEVIGALLDKLVPAALKPTHPEHRKIRTLMPALFTEEGSDYEKLLRITDFVSGMTDSYAVSISRRFMGIALPQ